MKIQVIASEIGEYGGVEMEPMHPPQRQRVRGDLGDQMRAPSRSNSAAKRITSSDSGVVLGAGRVSPAKRYSMVPINPVTWPASRRMASKMYDVVVLPLVPVMPVKWMRSSGRR